jgi:hypothetical protein
MTAEVPNLKHQIRNKFKIRSTKFQTNSQFEIRNSGSCRHVHELGRFGVLNLELGICLGFGVWDLEFLWSLGLGHWGFSSESKSKSTSKSKSESESEMAGRMRTQDE